MIREERAKELLRAGWSSNEVRDATGLSRDRMRRIRSEISRERMVRWGVTIAMLLLATVVIALLLQPRTVPQPASNQVAAAAQAPPQWVLKLLPAAQALRKQAVPEQWIFETGAATTERMESEVNLFASIDMRVQQALLDYSNIPQVAEIRKTFPNLYVTVFMANEGISRSVSRSSAQFDGRFFEICLVPRDGQNHPRIYEAFQYDPDWKAIMICAIDFPDSVWYDALVIHEFFHAFVDKKGMTVGRAERLSDPWIAEELAAHKLENLVLNQGSQGEYGRVVKQVAASIKAKSEEEFLSQITDQHLLTIDACFNRPCRNEVSLRTAQYLLTLLNEWKAQQNRKSLEDRTSSYRLLFKNLG